MRIKRIPVGDMQANCYVIAEDGCVLIDPGAEPERILAETDGKAVEAVLLTHGHFDHIGAAAYFQRAGAKVYVGKWDAEMTYTTKNLGSMAGVRVESFQADEYVSDGDRLKIAGLDILALATPGHSEGGMCYLAGSALFTGDTLFRQGIGRWDFPGGSYVKLINSIGEKLLTLDGDIAVYPGHGEESTLEFERLNNPYLGGNSEYDL